MKKFSSYFPHPGLAQGSFAPQQVVSRPQLSPPPGDATPTRPGAESWRSTFLLPQWLQATSSSGSTIASNDFPQSEHL